MIWSFSYFREIIPNLKWIWARSEKKNNYNYFINCITEMLYIIVMTFISFKLPYKIWSLYFYFSMQEATEFGFQFFLFYLGSELIFRRNLKKIEQLLLWCKSIRIQDKYKMLRIFPIFLFIMVFQLCHWSFKLIKIIIFINPSKHYRMCLGNLIEEKRSK